MAAVEYDLNTGQPIKTGYQANNTDVTQTSVSGPQKTVTNTTGTQTTTGTQRTNSSSYQLNTTPAIMAALESAILQMTDRPAISQAQLDAQVPLAKAIFNVNSGWVYQNPLTGLSMSQKEAQMFNDQQMAKRETVKQEAGVIAGGTADQRAISDARLQEIKDNKVTQGKYTKEAAFADAQNLGSYFTRILTEQQMPGILRGAEGSGASQGSTRALLTQQAIARNAESAAKTGIDAATAYGQVNNQLAATLEALTRQDPNGIAAQLLQAINISKGMVQSGSQSSNTQTNQTTNTNQQSVANADGKVETVYKDFDNGPTNPVSNIGVTAAKDTYTPISKAGTGYVQADPIQYQPAKEIQTSDYAAYGENDSNVFFDD